MAAEKGDEREPQDFPAATYEVNPDLAKHTMDTAPLKEAFKSVFAGWMLELREMNFTSALGGKSTRIVSMIHRDEKRRLTNDAGADYLFSAVYPLIGPGEASTKATVEQIVRSWRSTLKELKWTLMKSYLFDGNPYLLKDINVIPQIITRLTPLYLISLRAQKGWTMEKFAGAWTSELHLNQPVVQMAQQNKGLGEKLAGAIPKW